MNAEITAYHASFTESEQHICITLEAAITAHLPEATCKIWHGHPVWFLNDNPVTGYSRLKSGIQLFFWSGQSFDEPALKPSGKFKAAGIIFTGDEMPDPEAMQRWFEKARTIQWDYKNIVKRKGRLEWLQNS